MKKALAIFAALMITSVTCFATVPADHPKLAEYFAKRFVRLTYGPAVYEIDFNQVQAITIDYHGHASLKHAPINKGTWGRGQYWIFYKNGAWTLFNKDKTTPDPMKSWKDYKAFLQANPQFLSIP